MLVAMKPLFASICVAVLFGTTAAAEPAWHHPLYIGGGGLWRQRVRVAVRNDMARDATGDPVALTVGKARGQIDIVDARAEAIRVCDALGREMLFAIERRDGGRIVRGPILARATLTIPVECPAGATATYFVYFDNPAAWQVPDFLEGGGRLRNGGFEAGSGSTPDGWRHDDADPDHRAFWVAESPHSGRKCAKTVVAAGAEPTWIATRQQGIYIVGGAKYVMTAWVKARDVKGQAGWYVHVGHRRRSMMISPMLYGGGGSYDWKQVRAEFTAPADATVAQVGTVLRGTGTAWFDDVELTCAAEPRLRATTSPPERLRVRIRGADSAWIDTRPDLDCRVPLRVVNFDAKKGASGLVSVDTAAAFARLRGTADIERLRVIAGGEAVPFFRLGGVLLFDAKVEPLTAQTYHVYCAELDRRTLSKDRESTSPLVANPALPGAGDGTRRGGVFIGDYAALLEGPRNLVRNASFEAGDALPTDWSDGGQRPAHVAMRLAEGGLFGKRCIETRVPASAQKSWVGWRQGVLVEPGKTYLFAAWLKTRDVTPNVQLHAHCYNAAGAMCASRGIVGAGPALTGTNGWTMISGLFPMPSDAATFHLHLTMLASGTVWHDGVALIEVRAGEALALERRDAKSLRRLTVWPVPAIEKVFRDDLPGRPRPESPRISCARNEQEPLQLALRGPDALTGVRAVVDAPVGPRGARLPMPELCVVGYVPVDYPTNYYSSSTPVWHRKYPESPSGCDGWSGLWPDPLLPRSTFDLEPHATQPVWVTVSVPHDAPAGDYRSELRFERSGTTVATAPFTVRVRSFALPTESHVKAIYDCRHREAWRRPDRTRDETLRQMWRFLAARRLCPDTLRTPPRFTFENGRVTPDFTEFDRAAAYYFDELKLPHAYTPWQFYLFGWGHLPGAKFGEAPYEGEYPYEGVDRSKLRPEYVRVYQECLRAFWSHVKERGWADRITLYISDEPRDADGKIRAQMKALCDMIHAVDPDIPIYSSTWHPQPEWEGYLDVWGIGHYGIVPQEKIRALQKGGATIWWTTDGQMCTDTPYCAIERLLPHYCFAYGAEAYEFWGVDWLTYDPYEYGWHRYNPHDFGPGQKRVDVRYPNGDGFLAYPGGPIGHDGPVSSVRLEQAREGVEDYEYLYLLRQRIEAAEAAGRDVSAARKALESARALVPMPCPIGRYSTRALPNPTVLYEIREQVARAIEALG